MQKLLLLLLLFYTLFLRFLCAHFVDLVKRRVLTLIADIQRCRNDHFCVLLLLLLVVVVVCCCCYY